MPLTNKTNKKKITDKIVYCKNVFTQGTGLSFRSKESVKNTAWIFVFKRPRAVSITMMFVFFPIDLMFLDKNKKIVEIKESLKPWSFYNPKYPACYIIEVDSGVVSKTRIKIGDILEFD